MNRADRMLAVLRKGPATRIEICTFAGPMLVNNAAAELRAKGFDVRCDKNGSNPTYTLGEATGGLDEASSPTADRHSRPVAVSAPVPQVASPSVTQLSLEVAA